MRMADGIKQKLFAWMMAHLADQYEAAMEPRKQKLFAGVAGRVLELGPGAGPNLKYLSPDLDYLGLEPNVYMHSYLEQAARDRHLKISLETLTLEAAHFPDQSFDVVISTLVLCSVPNLQQTLREIYRVLKPGGRFLFVEHVAAPEGTLLRHIQNGVRPLWQWIGDGCQTNRETAVAIESIGFSKVDYEAFNGPVPIAIVRPHIYGIATK